MISTPIGSIGEGVRQLAVWEAMVSRAGQLGVSEGRVRLEMGRLEDRAGSTVDERFDSLWRTVRVLAACAAREAGE